MGLHGFTRCLFLEGPPPCGVQGTASPLSCLGIIGQSSRKSRHSRCPPLPLLGLSFAPSQVQSLVSLGTWFCYHAYFCITKSYRVLGNQRYLQDRGCQSRVASGAQSWEEVPSRNSNSWYSIL